MEFQLDRSNSAITLSEVVVDHSDNSNTTYIGDSDAHERRRNEGWGRNLFLAYNTLGVVFGGLVTSPLYVYPSMHLKSPTEDDYLGIYSIIFCTLTLIGVVKYCFIALQADDQGEGGTLALYLLLCRHANISVLSSRRSNSDQYGVAGGNKKIRLVEFFEKSVLARRVLLFIAMLGMCMLIGDGILTPAVLLGDVKAVEVITVGDSLRIGASRISLTINKMIANEPALRNERLIIKVPWGNMDELRWCPSKDGKFSIKSTYRTLLSGNDMEQVVGSPALMLKIWHNRASPRAQMFAWKCIRNIVPCREKIATRLSFEDVSCPMCSAPSESLHHFLLECAFTRVVWFGTFFWGLLHKFSYLTAHVWIEGWISPPQDWPIDREIWILFTFSLYRLIWKAQCAWIFQNIKPDPSRISLTINKMIANEPVLRNERLIIKVPWGTLELGCVKINVDASFCKDKCFNGIGLIIRNCANNFGATRISSHRFASSEEGEALAVLEGVLWAKERRIPKVLGRNLFLAYNTLGVVFGGLVTSPLYVYPSMHLKSPTEDDYLGIYSIMFWTLTLIGVVKYCFIALQADDQGEGGTLALYSLLCRHANISVLSSRRSNSDQYGVAGGNKKISVIGYGWSESALSFR
ncbi:hypothetical protein GIB67_005262 [Kingdonia uniflora]|uniref:Reverse transcriptase zinc-binding domain-containing protein n=1 Tax=Kingdonia uniflora TaxID=39325 RepID=A0A7J7NNP2_9MAGN|nr:hypothetical protein GIB67_005262 [Kingdonia uniflora]